MTLVSLGVVLFGFALVILPELAITGFSLLVYNDPQRISAFDPEAIKYVALTHAVLGSVMMGWGVTLLMVIRGLYARGARIGWNIIVVSVLVWFVPDTAYSLLSGFWQNAVLNLVFAALFFVPLMATYKIFRDTSS